MTNTFEKTYQIDPKREEIYHLDKHRCIEMTDKEYMDMKNSRISKNDLTKKMLLKENDVNQFIQKFENKKIKI